MKKYMLTSLVAVFVIASNSDIVFNPYLFDIKTIHAYQSTVHTEQSKM